MQYEPLLYFYQLKNTKRVALLFMSQVTTHCHARHEIVEYSAVAELQSAVNVCLSENMTWYRLNVGDLITLSYFVKSV